jgi:hypothetical protein
MGKCRIDSRLPSFVGSSSVRIRVLKALGAVASCAALTIGCDETASQGAAQTAKGMSGAGGSSGTAGGSAGKSGSSSGASGASGTGASGTGAAGSTGTSSGAAATGTSGTAGTSGSGTGTAGSAGSSSGSKSGVAVVVSPKSIAVNVGTMETYTCTVTGSTNTGCTWKVTEASGGTIASSSANSAVYSAPASAGTYHIVATSSADTTASDTATVTVVAPMAGNCTNLPAANTWQNITPPALNMSEWCVPGDGNCPGAGDTANGQIGTYGANAFVVDKNNPGTIVLGTSSLGVWKSTDCGSTWTHIDTGMNGAALDGGRNWSMAIDPTNSNVLYTVSGYNQGGVFKSTDGGVNWAQVLGQNVLNATGATPCAQSADKNDCDNPGGFVEKIAMDPTNSQHLTVSFHTDCGGTTPLPGANIDNTNGWGCLGETTDGGQDWTLTTSAMPWDGTDGPGQMMVDSKTWYYAPNDCTGLWRTTTGGVSEDGGPAWSQVYNGCVSGGVYQASNGNFYTGSNTGSDNVVWSSDGINWNMMPNSPSAASLNGSIPMIDDGKTFYVGGGDGYYTAPLAAGNLTFSKIDSTPLTSVPDNQQGSSANVGYDATHHIFYSSNQTGGFWRYIAQ